MALGPSTISLITHNLLILSTMNFSIATLNLATISAIMPSITTLS